MEYFRLGLAQDEEGTINLWAGQFLKAREAGLLDNCRQLLRGVKGSGSELSPRSRAVVVHCQALLAALLDRRDEAEAGYRRSLALFRQAGDEVGIGWALNDLGTLHYARGGWTEAVDCYQEALTHLLPSRGGRTDEAMVRNNLGLALIGVGQVESGIQELEQASRLYRQSGRPGYAARVDVNLGQLYHRQGHVPRALETYRSALAAVRESGDRRAEIEILNSLGVLYRYQGAFDQALEHYIQSLSLAQTLNDLSGQALGLGNLGGLYQLQGERAQARSCYRQALALYEMLDETQGQAQMWGNLGHLLSFEGQLQEALASYQRGLALYREANDAAGEAAALVNVAGAYRDMGRYAGAQAPYRQALAIARELENLRLQDKALGAMGTLRLLQRQWDEAEALLKEALTLQRRRGDVHAQVESLYKMGRLAHERGRHDQVLAIVEPAWELAQEYEYGRWLYDITRLLGDAAQAQDDPGAINYYALAVVVARQYGDEERFRSSLAFLSEGLARSVERGRRESALEVGEYLIEFWQKEEWQAWTEPAVAHIGAMMRAIRAGQALPVEF